MKYENLFVVLSYHGLISVERNEKVDCAHASEQLRVRFPTSLPYPLLPPFIIFLTARVEIERSRDPRALGATTIFNVRREFERDTSHLAFSFPAEDATFDEQ